MFEMAEPQQLQLKLPDEEPHTKIDGAVYDDVEIQVCLVIDHGDGNEYEALGGDSEQFQREADAAVNEGIAHRWCYSVYWHLSVGGVEWVADFDKDDRVRAERLYCAMKAAVNLARGSLGKALEYGSTAVGAVA